MLKLLSVVIAGVLMILGTNEVSKSKNGQKILYVGNPSSDRGKSYAGFLKEHFQSVEAVSRRGFDPQQAESFDVVILDWSQSERGGSPESPLGPKERWHKPTVLLGSAGLLLAEQWEIHGSAG